MKNLTSIYTSDDFRSKKNSRKKKVNFQNKCALVVPKTTDKEKGEGATVAASHLPSPVANSAGSLDCRFAGRTGSVLPWKDPNSGKLPLTTTNVLPSFFDTKRRQSFQTFIFIDSPKQMKQMKLKDADESENRLTNTKVTNDTNNCS